MKLAALIIRILLGALLLFAASAYFFKFMSEPEITGAMKTVMAGFVATKYLLPLVKAVELLCGLSFLTGKFVKIMSVILMPISLNIFFINLLLAPDGIPIALFLLLGNLFLIYSNWSSYRVIFAA